MCESPAGWSTYYPKDVLFPDTYYLVNVDEKYRRQYKLKKGPIAPPTAAFAPAAVTRMLRERADKKKAPHLRFSMSRASRNEDAPPFLRLAGLSAEGEALEPAVALLRVVPSVAGT